MPDEDVYSTIRSKPPLSRKNPRFLSSFYEGLLRPHIMLATLVGAFALVWSQTPSDWVLALIQGDANTVLYFAMVTFTVLTGARLMQSIYLANRDYQSLEARLSDIFIFAAVAAFTSGAPLRLLPSSDIHWLALAYGILATVGIVNFVSLYRTRLQKKSSQIDYTIERRIQAVNILTFTHLAVAMFVVTGTLHFGVASPGFSVAIILSTFPTLVGNMLHSSQLTMKPKFLLSNAYDDPEKIVQRFRRLALRTAPSLTDEKIKQDLLADEFRTFQKITLVRASRESAEQITDCLLANFGYVFRHVFAEFDDQMLRRSLRCLICSCGGFGSVGWSSFYAIVNRNGATVGFVKLDNYREWDLYQGIEAVLIPLALVRIGGLRRLIRVYQRSKQVIASQPRLEPNEVSVAYLLVKPEARRMGFASSTLGLLINAVRAQSNDVLAARLVALVRERNAPALNLFMKLGFVPEPERLASPAQDPFISDEEVGAPVYLFLDLTK